MKKVLCVLFAILINVVVFSQEISVKLVDAVLLPSEYTFGQLNDCEDCDICLEYNFIHTAEEIDTTDEYRTAKIKLKFKFKNNTKDKIIGFKLKGEFTNNYGKQLEINSQIYIGNEKNILPGDTCIALLYVDYCEDMAWHNLLLKNKKKTQFTNIEIDGIYFDTEYILNRQDSINCGIINLQLEKQLAEKKKQDSLSAIAKQLEEFRLEKVAIQLEKIRIEDSLRKVRRLKIDSTLLVYTQIKAKRDKYNKAIEDKRLKTIIKELPLDTNLFKFPINLFNNETHNIQYPILYFNNSKKLTEVEYKDTVLTYLSVIDNGEDIFPLLDSSEVNIKNEYRYKYESNIKLSTDTLESNINLKITNKATFVNEVKLTDNPYSILPKGKYIYNTVKYIISNNTTSIDYKIYMYIVNIKTKLEYKIQLPNVNI
jgi:hypothetical protein